MILTSFLSAYKILLYDLAKKYHKLVCWSLSSVRAVLLVGFRVIFQLVRLGDHLKPAKTSRP